MYTMPTIYLRVSSLYPAFSLIFSFSVNIYINCAKCYQLPCAVLCYVQFQIRKRSAWFVLHLCKIFPFLLSSLPVPNAIEIIRSDVVCPVWPFSLSEFRSTPCGSGNECPSCGSSRAPVSSALWPASARRSRTLLRASEFRERQSGEHRWFRVVEKDLVVWAKRILTNCRIRMLRGDPREDFLPVGSGEMCPHLQNMVVSSELQMDK